MRTVAGQGLWTIIPNGVRVIALPENNAQEAIGNPVVVVGSWDGQVGLVKELEARAANINAHAIALSQPHTRMIPMYDLDHGPLLEKLVGEREQTYCYAAFASDTPYTIHL